MTEPTSSDTSASKEPSGAARQLGDFAPALVHFTNDLGLARRNGLTETEITEAITHLAFYAGWPRAMSAMTVAKQAFSGSQDDK